MKKHLFLIALACLFAAPVFSQAKGFKINPKVGVSLSRLADDPDDFQSTARPGYSLGGEVRLGKKWHLISGAHFNVMNYDLVDLTVDGEQPFEDLAGVKTLKVPVNLGVNLVNLKLLKLRTFGGVNFYKTLGVTDNDLGIQKSDFVDKYWGINAGVGLDLLFLTLDLQYEWGQTGIFANQSDTKYGTIGLSAGFKF